MIRGRESSGAGFVSILSGGASAIKALSMSKQFYIIIRWDENMLFAINSVFIMVGILKDFHSKAKTAVSIPGTV